MINHNQHNRTNNLPLARPRQKILGKTKQYDTYWELPRRFVDGYPNKVPSLSSSLAGWAMDYQELKRRLAHQIGEWIAMTQKVNILQEVAVVSKDSGDHTEFWKSMHVTFKSLIMIKEVAEHYDASAFDAVKVEGAFKQNLSEQIRFISAQIKANVKGFPCSETVEPYANHSKWYDNLRAIEEVFADRGIKAEAQEAKGNASNDVLAKIGEISKSHLDSDIPDGDADAAAKQQKILEGLCHLKTMSTNLFVFKDPINAKIEEFLNTVKSKNAALLGTLGVKLRAINNPVALLLINETKAMNGYALALKNQNTQQFTVDDVLQGLKGDRISSSSGPTAAQIEIETIATASLKALFAAFDDEFWDLVLDGYADPEKKMRQITKDFAPYIARTSKVRGKSLYFPLSLKLRHSRPSSPSLYPPLPPQKVGFQAKIRHLLAHVAAYWALDNVLSGGGGAAGAENIDKAKSRADKSFRAELRTPHAAQVVAMFRLLGIDSEKEIGKHKFSEYGVSASIRPGSLKRQDTQARIGESKRFFSNIPKHFAEIFTGEGKSVVLALTSAVVALMGCNVDCACYSEYLSSRDGGDFSNLFLAFGISSYVTYGTFNKLCERYLNQDGVVREVVEAHIKGTKASGEWQRKRGGRPAVLLIDEVDVFFGKEFYGNQYKPIATIHDETVKKFVEYVWGIRNDKVKMSYSNVLASPACTAMLSRFSSWTDLVTEQVKLILADLRSFLDSGTDYIIQVTLTLFGTEP